MIENTDFTVYVDCPRMGEHQLDVDVKIYFEINDHYNSDDWGDEKIYLKDFEVLEVRLVNRELKEREINYDVAGKTKITELIEQYLYDEYA